MLSALRGASAQPDPQQTAVPTSVKPRRSARKPPPAAPNARCHIVDQHLADELAKFAVPDEGLPVDRQNAALNAAITKTLLSAVVSLDVNQFWRELGVTGEISTWSVPQLLLCAAQHHVGAEPGSARSIFEEAVCNGSVQKLHIKVIPSKWADTFDDVIELATAESATAAYLLAALFGVTLRQRRDGVIFTDFDPVLTFTSHRKQGTLSRSEMAVAAVMCNEVHIVARYGKTAMTVRQYFEMAMFVDIGEESKAYFSKHVKSSLAKREREGSASFLQAQRRLRLKALAEVAAAHQFESERLDFITKLKQLGARCLDTGKLPRKFFESTNDDDVLIRKLFGNTALLEMKKPFIERVARALVEMLQLLRGASQGWSNEAGTKFEALRRLCEDPAEMFEQSQMGQQDAIIVQALLIVCTDPDAFFGLRPGRKVRVQADNNDAGPKPSGIELDTRPLSRGFVSTAITIDVAWYSVDATHKTVAQLCARLHRRTYCDTSIPNSMPLALWLQTVLDWVEF